VRGVQLQVGYKETHTHSDWCALLISLRREKETSPLMAINARLLLLRASAKLLLHVSSARL
jgi:hypothetical protein